VEIGFVVEIVRIVVPTAKIWPGSGHPFTLTEWLQETILVEMEKHLMILVKLSEEGAVELHTGIRENGEPWRNWRSWRFGPSGCRAGDPRTRS
jgi:hypothetical protein